MNGSIRQRSNGSWEIRYEGPLRPDGRRNQRQKTVRGTKRDAQKELNRLIHAVNNHEYVEPSRMTVSQYLDHWLTAWKPKVSQKTFDTYSEFVRVHLTPALGHHLLVNLQGVHIQQYYGKALQSGRRDGNGGLSAQTVLHHHRVLRKAFQQAVKWKMLLRNPCDDVDAPRPERKEMQVLNAEEITRLLDAARGTRLHIPVLLAVGTGMRRGEVLGLRWQDVDLKAGTISVLQSLQETTEGLKFKQPKTQKSRRRIALPSFLTEELSRHKAEQAEWFRMVGKQRGEADLVACRPDGSPMAPSGVSIAFAALVRKTGLPEVHFHGLRHSHATHLLAQNIHPKVVSDRLGHSTISITLDIYSHVLPGMQEEAARRVDDLFRGT